VCGRIKDLIIVRGRNHYPQVRQSMHGTHAHALHTPTVVDSHAYGTDRQDIERTAERAAPELRPVGLVNNLCTHGRER